MYKNPKIAIKTIFMQIFQHFFSPKCRIFTINECYCVNVLYFFLYPYTVDFYFLSVCPNVLFVFIIVIIFVRQAFCQNSVLLLSLFAPCSVCPCFGPMYSLSLFWCEYGFWIEIMQGQHRIHGTYIRW